MPPVEIDGLLLSDVKIRLVLGPLCVRPRDFSSSIISFHGTRKLDFRGAVIPSELSL